MSRESDPLYKAIPSLDRPMYTLCNCKAMKLPLDIAMHSPTLTNYDRYYMGVLVSMQEYVIRTTIEEMYD